jgi:hypothetical protein
MLRVIKNSKDLAWLLTHTRGFQRGQIADLHIHKHQLFDEETGRHIPANTVITAVIRYEPIIHEGAGIVALTRVAKLVMKGVSDFSVFEQDGGDFSEIGRIHAEAIDGRFRFWFDPHGEFYVICDEAQFEEVAKPGTPATDPAMSEWTFQAQGGELPDIRWLLDQLDAAGYPCAWRRRKRTPVSHPALKWEGMLMPADEDHEPASHGVHVQVYGPLDGSKFGITLRAQDAEHHTHRLLIALADLISRHYAGTCLAGTQVMQVDDWINRQASEWWTAGERNR